MPQDFDLRLNGKSVPIKSGSVTYTFDDANDGFAANIQLNRIFDREIYENIKPYARPDAQVYLDGELIITGKLTNTKPVKAVDGVQYQIEGWANTFNFVDSQLKPPYQIDGMTIHLLTIEVAKQTNTKVLHTGPALDIFETATVTPGMTGFQFIAPLANQRQHVLSSTNTGILLLQQADLKQPPVGTIEEDSPNSLLQKQFSAEYDYRRRFRTYKAISKRPEGNGEGSYTDANIKDPRLKLIFANDQVAGGLPEVAQYNAKLAVIDALQQQIPVVGWRPRANAPLWKPGTLVTLVSETLFVPEGFTYFIRAVEYSLNENSKTALLSLIPKEIYTNDTIKEPWF